MSICDICGESIYSDEMNIVPLDQVKELIRYGYVPTRHPREWDEMGHDPNVQNLLLQSPDGSSLDLDISRPGDAAKAFWILTVANATSDFGICSKCRNDIDDHNFRLSKKLEEQAKTSKEWANAESDYETTGDPDSLPLSNEYIRKLLDLIEHGDSRAEQELTELVEVEQYARVIYTQIEMKSRKERQSIYRALAGGSPESKRNIHARAGIQSHNGKMEIIIGLFMVSVAGILGWYVYPMLVESEMEVLFLPAVLGLIGAGFAISGLKQVLRSKEVRRFF